MQGKVGKVTCMKRKDKENMSKQSFCAYFVLWMISEQRRTLLCLEERSLTRPNSKALGAGRGNGSRNPLTYLHFC